MEQEQHASNKPYAQKLAAQLICLFLIVGTLCYLQGIFLLLVFSMMLAMILFPMARKFEQWKMPRVLASILSIAIAAGIVVGLFYLIVNQVVSIGKDGGDIITKFQGIFDTIINWAHEQFGISENVIMAKLKSSANSALSNASTYVQTAFSSVGGILANTLLLPIFIFFMLCYRDFFREFFFYAFKSTNQQKVNDTLIKIYNVVHSYLFGLVTVMGIVGILNSVGLMVLGIPYAWFFGILASLLMLFPYIGIAIGSLLPALFALAVKDSFWYSLGVIGWFQVVQFLEANVITPKIVGGKVSVNPLMSILSIIIGGLLFGLAGLILAIPMIAILKVIFDAIPSMAHFGFLIGETDKYHLKRESKMIVMKRWQLKIRPKKKNIRRGSD